MRRVLFLAVCLLLLGCSDQTENPTVKEFDDLRRGQDLMRQLEQATGKSLTPDQQAEFLPAFERLARAGTGDGPDWTPTRMTSDAIAEISDEQLAQYLYDFVLTVHNRRGYNNQVETVASLPKGLRAVYLLFVLEGEIGNGGYLQYFFNNGDKFVDQVVEFLQEIGAPSKARLTREAATVYRKMIKNQTEVTDAARAEIGKFDSPYYELEGQENIQQLLAAYVRAKPSRVEFDNSH